MTGRTHDLAAFTALLGIVATSASLPHISLATGIVAFGANMIGGLAPDIDQPTADLWRRLPAGSVVGRILSPLFGGHRFISHSLLGIVIFGYGLAFFLNLIRSILIVDMQIVWWAFMIGFVSHLVMDTFTKDGVPWLFPIPFKIGIPPFRFMRIKTGGIFEKSLVFPGLLAFNFYIFYVYHSKLSSFIHNNIK